MVILCDLEITIFILFFILQNYNEFVNTKWYKKKTFENKWWSLDLKTDLEWVLLQIVLNIDLVD